MIIGPINPMPLPIELQFEEMLEDFSPSEGTPGDHIKAHRVGYTHHGIYLGNYDVIHYLDDGVTITDYDTFKDDASVEGR